MKTNVTTDNARAYILKLERRLEMLHELNELITSLKTPALNNKQELMKDVEIGVPTFFIPGWRPDEPPNRWHRVRLNDDLGIDDIQESIKSILMNRLTTRKKELEHEIKQLIGEKE